MALLRRRHPPPHDAGLPLSTAALKVELRLLAARLRATADELDDLGDAAEGLPRNPPGADENGADGNA
jgi:hypothetical protein